MKKCNSVIFLFIFLIGFVGLLTMLNVRATDDANIGGIGGEYQGGSSVSGSGGGGSSVNGNSWPEITDTTGVLSTIDGIRVSFVTSDGVNLGSKDYIRDNTYYTNAGIYNRLMFSTAVTERGAKVKVVANKRSKVNYSKNSIEINNIWVTVESNSAMYNYISPLSDFIDVFSEFGSASQNIDGKVANHNYTNMFDFLINTNLDSKTNQEKIYNAFNNLFKQVTGKDSIEEYRLEGEDLFDLFLVFEPVTLLEIKGSNESTSNLYLGTAYELAAQSWKLKGNYAGFNNLVNYALPCASYLNGENLVNSIPSTSSLSKGFTSQSYFYGGITISSSSSNYSACNGGSGLGDKIKEKDSSVGMGIIWLSSYINETLPDNLCEYIKENSNWNSSLSSEFDRLYNSGGVDAILNRYQNITYRDDNGENQQISAYWFVHQCTCYGMYDYYENNNAPSYTKQNQTSINQISRIFGSSNWYIEPSLSDVYQGAFPEGRFSAYYLQVRRYLNSHDLGDLPFDRITEEKFRELNCGASTQNWCSHYEQWHDNMIVNYPNLSNYPTIDQIENASEEVILNEYKDQLQTMLDAYNLVYSPINGFSWTVDQTVITQNGNNNKYSYLDNCLGSNQGVSCAAINQFYGNRINDSLNCQTVRNFDFSAFNNRYGTSINGNWYAANCGCVEVTPNNCTPNNNVGTCLDEGSISYQDSSQGIIDDEYWNSCVFNDYGKYDVNVHKVADQNSSLSYYDDNLSNEYCEIYCIEDVSASLPSRNVTVEAGRWFTLDNGYVNGSRTCRTKSVDWEQFEADLAEANQSGNAVVAKGIVEKMKNCYFSSDAPSLIDGYVYGDINDDGDVTPSDYLLLRRIIDGSVTPDERQQIVGDLDLDGQLTEADYQILKEYILNLTNTVVYSSSFDADDLYKVDPKATIIYSDNTYSYSGELKATTTYSEIKNEMVNCVKKTVRVMNESVELYDCSNGYATATRTAKTTFSLDEGVYQYVLKKNNLSVHAYDISNYTDINFTNNYIDIGFSNFPVSYSTKAGMYGTMHNQGQFDINYSNLGHVSGSGSRTAVDTILSATNSTTYGKWECEYSVYDGLIPDNNDDDDDNNKGKGGINVIYRPIDLITPFPDIDASNRETGSNWCGSNGDCSYDNDVVIAYINNNRGVSDYELYQQEPMYTFILTPAIITEIRRYNNENSYASYTGTLNGQNFDYKCQNGRTCISDYLTYLIDITGAKNQPGTCVADRFRSYNDPTNFENCRY